ncbi:MAG: hypothetical protein H7Z14_11330 [Anaerolineae bacterium]|nr:hypothetical protein [Phycisphaerae bacterium]
MSESKSELERATRRTSLYLVLRADALLGALRFFSTSSGDVVRRQLQFLAQSDFWEWEIDNLIYSFTNLAERRETWRSPRATAEKLGKLGIAVNAKLLRNARWRSNGFRRFPVSGIGKWKVEQSGQRVAPVALLKQVIDQWNQVIDLVEAQFIAPMRKNAERWNIQTRKDLASLRKTMPTLEEMDE